MILTCVSLYLFPCMIPYCLFYLVNFRSLYYLRNIFTQEAIGYTTVGFTSSNLIQGVSKNEWYDKNVKTEC